MLRGARRPSGVGKRAQALFSPVPTQRHHQLSCTDFDPARVQLVHDCLPGVGCGSGSPTLNRLRLTLKTQARKASDSPQSWRRGRGADLKHRLTSRSSGLGPKRPHPPEQRPLLPSFIRECKVQGPKVAFVRPEVGPPFPFLIRSTGAARSGFSRVRVSEWVKVKPLRLWRGRPARTPSKRTFPPL